MKRRIVLSILLLLAVSAVATIVLLHLHREAWAAHGEAPLLWDVAYVLMEGSIPFAVAQYVAVAAAFALAWVLWLSPFRLLRNICIAWGITWLPVAFIATGDVTASSDGPFNFPESMFVAPIFAFFCMAELGFALLFRVFQAPRCKANPLAERMKKRKIEAS